MLSTSPKVHAAHTENFGVSCTVRSLNAQKQHDHALPSSCLLQLHILSLGFRQSRQSRLSVEHLQPKACLFQHVIVYCYSYRTAALTNSALQALLLQSLPSCSCSLSPLHGDPHQFETPCGVQDSKFFQMFDVDGDGLISYTEYLLLITFLSIPVEVSRPDSSQCSETHYNMVFGYSTGVALFLT